MKISIRNKFIFLYAFTVFFLVLLFSISLIINFRSNLLKTIDSSLITAGRILRSEIFRLDENGEYIEESDPDEVLEEEEDDKTPAEEFLEELAEYLNPIGLSGQLIVLKSEENKLSVLVSTDVYRSELLLDQESLSKTIRQRIYIRSFNREMEPVRILNYYIQTPEGERYIIQLAKPLEDMLKILQRTKLIFFALAPVFLFIIIVIGSIFVKKAFSPIRSIIKEVNQITVEDLSLRIKSLKGNDEISELIETFNEMISRLENSFKQIKQFSSDVSHELKTPLTVIKGEIESMQRTASTKEDYKKTLESLTEEINKLQAIISNLLFLSYLESYTLKSDLQETLINECLLESFNNVCNLANKKKQHFTIKDLPSVRIRGDKNLLVRLFSNIMENSVKYTPEKGKIEVSLKHKGNKIIAAVSDNGIGIDKKDQLKIFDRFYRVDESRSKEDDNSGSGLGLAIVSKIAKLHNAKIEISSTLGQGTEFSVIFEK